MIEPEHSISRSSLGRAGEGSFQREVALLFIRKVIRPVVLFSRFFLWTLFSRVQ